MGHYIRMMNNITDSVHKCQFTAHAVHFLTRHFMSHAKVITLKVILRRLFLQQAKAPQLSDYLTETRTCPQISIVSTGLLTAAGAASSMLNCSESLEQRYLFHGKSFCFGYQITCCCEKRGQASIHKGWSPGTQGRVVKSIFGDSKAQSMASVPPCYYCYLCVQ